MVNVMADRRVREGYESKSMRKMADGANIYN